MPIRRINTAVALLAVVLIGGCATPGQKLLVAENGIRLVQDTWSGMLTNKTVTDPPSIIAGTAAINHGSASVGKAYTFKRMASTQPNNAALNEAFAFWADEAYRLAADVGNTITQIRAEKESR